MTKVFFILSAVVIFVAGIFAYQNGREFANVRQHIAVTNASIKTEQDADKVVVGRVNQLVADTGRVQGELDAESEKLKLQKNKLAQAESEATRTQEEFDAKDKKQKALAAQLAELPQGVKPETMAEDIQKLKKAKLEYEAQAELKKKEVAAEEEKIAGVQKRLDDVVHKIDERRKNFERNSLASRILAVNQDWGFVVINAGAATGLTQDTKLIVTRGAKTVGKVSILSVDDSCTLASIVPDAVSNGMSIAPGDRVILENLVQN